MGFSTDVRLPYGKAPIFPRRCVVCGAYDPESAVAIRSRALGGAGGAARFVPWFLRRPFQVDVPACLHCAHRLRRQRTVIRFARWFAVLAAGVAVFAVLRLLEHHPLFAWLDGELQTIAAIVGALLFLLPAEYFLSAPFDLRPVAGGVDFEFQDPRLAEEFASLNGARVE